MKSTSRFLLLPALFAAATLASCSGGAEATDETPTNGDADTEAAADPAAEENAAEENADASASTDEAPAADPAVGTWRIDGAATFEASREVLVGWMSPEQVEMALPMLQGIFEDMNATMTIAADGSISGEMDLPMGDATGAMSGTWKHENGSIVLETTDDDTGETEVFTATLDGDRLACAMPAEEGEPEMTMVFVRVEGDGSGE